MAKIDAVLSRKGLNSIAGIFIALITAFGLAACSGLRIESKEGRRSFTVRKVWVRDPLSTPNNEYRKINRSTPVLVGSTLLSFNSIEGLVAWDRESGRELWRLKITNGVEGDVASFKDRIYFGASDGLFYAVNARTGAVVWTSPTRSEVISEPLFDGEAGVVYVLSASNTVHAFEADSGKPLWVYNRQDASAFAIRGGTKPALYRGVLYVGFNDGSLAALNSKSGQVIWDVQLNKNKKFKDIDASPLIDGDRLYVAGFDDRLYCLSTERGEILWRQEGGGYTNFLLQGQRLYYATSTGELRALDKENGQTLWTVPVSDGIATTPVFYKGLLVYGESRGELKFVDAASGKWVAGFEPGRGVFGTPLVDEKNDRVYFVSNESNVYALEAKWKNSAAFPWLEPLSSF